MKAKTPQARNKTQGNDRKSLTSRKVSFWDEEDGPAEIQDR